MIHENTVEDILLRTMSHHDTFDRLSRERPEMFDLMGAMADKCMKKAKDYCGHNTSDLANLERSERIGIEPWRNTLGRMQDKWQRLETFAQVGHYAVEDESFFDTCLDNAIYSLLLIRLWHKAGK